MFDLPDEKRELLELMMLPSLTNVSPLIDHEVNSNLFFSPEHTFIHTASSPSFCMAVFASYFMSEKRQEIN